MVKLSAKLQTLSGPALVEALFLVSQQLNEALPNDRFLHRLDSVSSPLNSPNVKSVVLEVVNSIEKQEGKPIYQIPFEKRQDYSSQLDSFVQREFESALETVDEVELGAEIEQLNEVA
jgi:hypothetical protein